MMRSRFASGALLFSVSTMLHLQPAAAETFLVDLTHPMGTFAPLDGDIGTPDLEAPILDSIPYPSFGAQSVYEAAFYFPIDRGQFWGGRMVLSDHHGTHLDAPAHFQNNPESAEPGNPPPKYLHEITPEELIGPAVLIDISSRVLAELDKNGGDPSPDTGVTDFSDSSNNVVTADDVEAVAEQLADRVWLAVNTGWSRFYYDPNWETSPYLNGWNFPGFNNEAIDKLIELEDAKGVRIAGIVIDNIGVDSGESSRGRGDKWEGSWHSHVRGLQRGWGFVENAANLGQLAMAKPGSCTVIVGAPRNVQGGGGPSRVFAMCEK